LVIDEAHQLEDVATQYFGIAVSNYRVEDLLRDVDRELGSVGRGFTPRQTDEIAQSVSRAAERSRTFFSALSMGRMEVADSTARYPSDSFVDYFQDGAMLAGALEGLEATLVLAGRKTPPYTPAEISESLDEVTVTLARRARELRDDLTFLIRASDTDFVYYV